MRCETLGEKAQFLTIPVCMQCDGHIKTTVFCICEQSDPLSPTGNIKVSSKNQNEKKKKIDLLKVNRSYQSWPLRRGVGGRVKFGSPDHGDSAGDRAPLFKSSLSFNFLGASRAARKPSEITFSPSSHRSTLTFCSLHAL